MPVPKSNTWVLVLPTALWFGLASAHTTLWQASTDNRYAHLTASGLGIPLIAVGISQVRSGYIWRNLAPGNRGEHRTESPRKFLFSTCLNLAFGLGIATFFIYRFLA